MQSSFQDLQQLSSPSVALRTVHLFLLKFDADDLTRHFEETFELLPSNYASVNLQKP
jgi:hypothetical protein